MCTQHGQQLCDELQAWGLGHLTPKTAAQRHRRARLAAQKGLLDMSSVDPMNVALKALERLLEGQFFYEENDEDVTCVICAHDGDNLLKLAANAAATKVRLLRGQDN